MRSPILDALAPAATALQTASPTPPKVKSAATTNRRVKASPRSAIPPPAAIAGTSNWTTAALVRVWPRRAAYQST